VLCSLSVEITSIYAAHHIKYQPKPDTRVSKAEKLCLHWRQCDRSQVSGRPELAALHVTAVIALAALNSSEQTASLFWRTFESM